MLPALPFKHGPAIKTINPHKLREKQSKVLSVLHDFMHIREVKKGFHGHQE